MMVLSKGFFLDLHRLLVQILRLLILALVFEDVYEVAS
jgi:hypothetical protein